MNAPSRNLDFFYFFGSGYAYLSVMRIDALADAAGVTVTWRPFSVRALMIEQNNMIREQKQKMAYVWRDIERRAARNGVPFVRPPIWPTDPDQLANRVGIVAQAEGWCREYTLASFRSWYLDGQPLGAEGPLAAILAGLGRNAAEVIGRANSDDIRARYDAQTDVARRLGAFGSPTFAVGSEIFWGDDRLEEAIAWAAGTHPAQRNAAG
ncbi:MAG: 2-hydroxychromene-2-carboxylate isomerase [Rhizobiaceae bacterium]|nr:2-hydroxychromene-2-carboxylate isomerase [Rhizobiaceae bacterium]